MGTRGGDVGEHTRGAAEDIVLYLHALIYRHVVLYAYAVADMYVVADVDVLPEGAVFAYHGALLYVAEMPYLGAGTYGAAVVDIRAFVYEYFVSHCFFYCLMPDMQRVSASVQYGISCLNVSLNLVLSSTE